MPVYSVNHTLLGPGPSGNTDWKDAQAIMERTVLKPGQVVTEKDLIDAGFDGKDGRKSVAQLLEGKQGGYSAAIAVVPGTENLDLSTRLPPARASKKKSEDDPDSEQ